jgi:hypothetical protein
VGYEKPALVAEPATVDLGMVARVDRFTLPSRIVADVLQPTAQPVQTGRDVLDVPGPRLEAIERRVQGADRAAARSRCPRRRAVRLVLEGRDLVCATAVSCDRAARPPRHPRRSACSGSRDAALRGRGR